MEHTLTAAGHGGGVHGSVHPLTGSLAADQLHTLVRDKLVEDTHGVGAAAYAGQHRVRQTPLFFQNLLACFSADDALEVTDDHGIGVGTHHGAQHIQGIVYPADPLPHGLVYCVL